MSGASALLLGLLTTFLMFAALWAATLRGGDVSVIDAFWGPGFAILAVTTYLARQPGGLEPVVMTACILVWGARLAAHMHAKHVARGGEDARYRAMREKRGARFAIFSLYGIFGVQAAALWLAASPIHVGLIGAAARPGRIWFFGGLALFLVGFAIEVVADAQLRRFKSDPSNAGRVFDRGLWAWSRHPHYFGEVTLWWGLGAMGCGLAGGGLFGLVAFAGPALLTVLILKVSGVALTEAIMRNRQGYAAYAANVPAFIPRPPGPPKVGQSPPPSPSPPA